MSRPLRQLPASAAKQCAETKPVCSFTTLCSASASERGRERVQVRKSETACPRGVPKAAQAQGESDERARGLVSQRSYYGRLGSNKVANRLVNANQIGRKQQQQPSSTAAAAASVSASSDAAVDVNVAGNRFYLIFDFLFFSRGVTPAWAYLANKQAAAGRGRSSDAGRDSETAQSLAASVGIFCRAAFMKSVYARQHAPAVSSRGFLQIEVEVSQRRQLNLSSRSSSRSPSPSQVN